jgi:protein CpxP
MKMNKTLIATLAIGGLLTLSSALLAQDSTNTPPPNMPAGAPPAGGRGMRGGPTIDQLTKALDLTDDEKAKVKPILDDRDQKIKDLRADTTLSPEDRRTKMQDIRTDTTAKLKDVLTPDQFEKYQKMGPGMRQRRNAAPPADTNAPAAPPQA